MSSFWGPLLLLLSLVTATGAPCWAGRDPMQNDPNRICPQYGNALDTYANTLESQIDRLKLGILQTELQSEAAELTALLMEKAAELVSIQKLKNNFKKAWDARKPNPYYQPKNGKYQYQHWAEDPVIYTSNFKPTMNNDPAEDMYLLQKALISKPKGLPADERKNKNKFQDLQVAVVGFLKKGSPLTGGPRGTQKSMKTVARNVFLEQTENAATSIIRSTAEKGASNFLKNSFVEAERNLLRMGAKRFVGGGFNPVGAVLVAVAPMFMGYSYRPEVIFNKKVDETGTNHPYGKSSDCKKSNSSPRPEIIFGMGQTFAPGWLYCSSFEGNPDGFFAIDDHSEYADRAKVFTRIRNQYMAESEAQFRLKLHTISTRFMSLRPKPTACTVQVFDSKAFQEMMKKQSPQREGKLDLSGIKLDQSKFVDPKIWEKMSDYQKAMHRQNDVSAPTFVSPNPNSCKNPIPNLYDWAKLPTDLTIRKFEPRRY